MIKAILFDSGKVLNYPTTGNWFISPNFFNIVDKDLFENIDSRKIHQAFENATKYISSITCISDKNEELICFTEFYSIFSRYLPELELEECKIRLLAEDLVYNPQKYTFYSDVFAVIPTLSKKYKLGIVSDAWPSLTDVYESADLKRYFATIIISSVLGTQKPDKRMYEAALENLKISPQETIFIDDNPKNCDGAKQIGMKAYLLSRNSKSKKMLEQYGRLKGYEIIYSLHTLVDI